METIAKVRCDYHVHGKSLKQIVRERGLSRNTVRKIIRTDVTALEYTRSDSSPNQPELGAYSDQLTVWLKEDAKLGRKRRRTAKRMHEQLQKQDYAGAYDSVQRFVKRWKEEQGHGSTAKVYIPLCFDSGDAMQFDWSLEHVEIAGAHREVKVSHFRLSHSRKLFFVAFYREKLEMVMEAHNRAFAYFGGSTKRIIYDNPTTIVHRILKGKERDINKRFTRLASHYLFEPVMCNPASGWEKGQVEKQVQDVRNQVFCPKLKFQSLEELNAHLQSESDRLATKAHPTISDKTIDEVFAEEQPYLIRVQRPYEAYTEHEITADRCSLVRYDRMHYSVNCIAANRAIILRAYADRITVLYKDEVIASHSRSFAREGVVYEPWHYLDALQRKPGALRDGAPFKQWDDLPEAMASMRQKLARIVGGDRQFVSLLCVAKEHGVERVAKGCQAALDQGVIQAEWILNHLSQQEEIETPAPASVSTDLHLQIEPEENCNRYDTLLSSTQRGANAIH